MASSPSVSLPRIPVGEYLGSVYRPDVDYVDGELERRNVGEFDHAIIQKAILFALSAQERIASVRAMQELRVQASETRFRVPDVCLIPSNLRTPIIKEAPLLCVEVLSPRDSVLRMRHRCMDFLRMGVPQVWIFNPKTRVAHILTNDGMRERREGLLRLDGTRVELNLNEIFAVLDES